MARAASRGAAGAGGRGWSGAARAKGGGRSGGRTGGGTRRRGAALEGAILQAAWEVLSESGYHGFTYEAIAARAATSRPVLYRRWPRREDLLLATLTRFWSSRPIETPDTGSLREDAIGLLHAINTERAQMVTLLSVQLADYFRESGTTLQGLREVLRLDERPNRFVTMLERAVARGELAEMPRSRRVTSLPIDLMRHDMLVSRSAITDAAIHEIVDDIWLPLLGVRPS